MPTSDWDNIAPILREIHRLQPRRIIDLGIGFGKYGPLCRELMDGMWGRCRPDQWQTLIHGIEIWEVYRNPSWNLYSKIEIRDFSVARIAGWDLVLMIDSLEHLPQLTGESLLVDLVRDNKHVIVSVPNGPMAQNEPVYGNPYERHLATYTGQSFAGYEHTVLHAGMCIVVSIKGKG